MRTTSPTTHIERYGRADTVMAWQLTGVSPDPRHRAPGVCGRIAFDRAGAPVSLLMGVPGDDGTIVVDARLRDASHGDRTVMRGVATSAGQGQWVTVTIDDHGVFRRGGRDVRSLTMRLVFADAERSPLRRRHALRPLTIDVNAERVGA